jgi:hypothetical protein
MIHPWIKMMKALWRQVNGGALQWAMHRAQRKQEKTHKMPKLVIG